MPQRSSVKRPPKKKEKSRGTAKEAGELRQDIITGKWSVIATGRAKRPDNFATERKKPVALPKYKEGCPFCDLANFPQEPDVLRLPDDPDRWQVHIFGNKYPAFSPHEEFRAWNEGPYRAMEAVGYHEVLATRWHNQLEPLMNIHDIALLLEALVLRYRQLRSKPSVNYVQIINNHGPAAGGSLEHPHHQIITTPVLPDDVIDLLQGAEAYGQKNGEDAFTAMLRFEQERGTRVVYENELFVAFCPYASRVPFETWIMPKAHEPFFEQIGPVQREGLAEALWQVLARLYHGLHDPPYNYYILSAPCDDTGFVCSIEACQQFRWHVQVTPRLNTWGGFEIGTGLEINTSLPEESAAFLRDVNLPTRL